MDETSTSSGHVEREPAGAGQDEQPLPLDPDDDPPPDEAPAVTADPDDWVPL